MGSRQVIARDLRRALKELRAIEAAGGLSPDMERAATAMVRLVEMIRRKILFME